jgi:hypothetical protein
MQAPAIRRAAKRLAFGVMAKTPCVGDVLDDATTTRCAMFRQEHAPQSLASCCLIRDALGAAKMHACTSRV